MGNQMGSRALISDGVLKEPVTIQYSGNRKNRVTRTRITTANTL